MKTEIRHSGSPKRFALPSGAGRLTRRVRPTFRNLLSIGTARRLCRTASVSHSGSPGGFALLSGNSCPSVGRGVSSEPRSNSCLCHVRRFTKDGSPYLRTFSRSPFRLPRSKRGFSLIEVALALLVFSIGILSILALLPTGVSLSSDARDQTYMTAFAEATLNAVAVELERNPAFWYTNNFDNYAAGYAFFTTLPYGAATQGVVIANTGVWRTNEYKMATDPNITDYAFRYKLKLERSANVTGELLEDPKQWTLWGQDTNTGKWTGRRYWAVENVYYVQDYNEHVIKASLRMRAGKYGDTKQRYFLRYYYDFGNYKIGS